MLTINGEFIFELMMVLQKHEEYNIKYNVILCVHFWKSPPSIPALCQVIYSQQRYKSYFTDTKRHLLSSVFSFCFCICSNIVNKITENRWVIYARKLGNNVQLLCSFDHPNTGHIQKKLSAKYIFQFFLPLFVTCLLQILIISFDLPPETILSFLHILKTQLVVFL